MTPSGLPRWLAGFCATVAALIEWVAQKPDNHRDKLDGDWAARRLFVTTSPERRKSLFLLAFHQRSLAVQDFAPSTSSQLNLIDIRRAHCLTLDGFQFDL